jgi:predicted PurR-regulated permease PerM
MLSKIWDKKTAQVLSTALIFILVILFLYGARQTLTLFLFAILFAYFIEPLVRRLNKPLRSRTLAIAAVYVALVGVLVGLGFLIGPRIAAESKSLVTSLPSLVDKMGSGQLVIQVGARHGWSEERLEQIQNYFVAHKSNILGIGTAIAGKLAEPAQHIWWLVLIPILSLFFLRDGQLIAEGVIELGRTPGEVNLLQSIVRDVNLMLGSYIRAQFLLSLLTLAVYTAFFSIMGVPYAFILGPLAGIFEFVPVVGPAVAVIGVFVICVLSGYPHLIGLAIFFAVWRLLQDYVAAPRIMGRSLEITPLLQIFAVLAGGEIAGVVGALISVPAVACLRIFWRQAMVSDGIDRVAVDHSRELDLDRTTDHTPDPFRNP